MTKQEVEQLFEDNVREIQKMNIAAGSMVRGLIYELERSDRNTYIRLRDAEKEGHVVYYDFVEGEMASLPSYVVEFSGLHNRRPIL